MYKYYKKEGPVIQDKYKNGLISAEQFKAWINSTKIKEL